MKVALLLIVVVLQQLLVLHHVTNVELVNKTVVVCIILRLKNLKIKFAYICFIESVFFGREDTGEEDRTFEIFCASGREDSDQTPGKFTVVYKF